MIQLDRNESYWMLDEELAEVASSGGAHELSTYPDYSELKTALAAYAGVAPEQILVTPGSDAAIEHIARFYAGSGGEVVLPVPTFYGYESILARVGTKTVPILYEEQEGHFVFPLAKTIEAFERDSAKVLFLCHPNNPLGSSLSIEDISALSVAARGREALLVSDEAYFEFSSGTSFLLHLAELPNLVIIRTLSKSFALAGARVGYAIAAPDTVKKLEQFLLPWPVAHPSIKSALALLSHAEKVRMRREVVMQAREYFIEILRAVPGITVYQADTNFVLVRVPNAERARDAFLAQDIRVALGESMTRFPEAKAFLENTLRVAVPAPEDMLVVVGIFRQLFTK